MTTRLWLAAILAASPAFAVEGPPAAAAKTAAKDAEGAAPEVAYAHVRKGADVVKLPLFSPEAAATPIAQIDDDVVRLRELTEALSALHEAPRAPGEKPGKKDFGPILERLIDAHLLVREGRQMGIGELPEVMQAVAELKEATARQMLQERALKGVAADPSEIERIYRDGVREWKVRSVLVAKEADAKWMRAQLKAGGSYDALAKKLVAEKKAQGGEQGGFLPRAKMLPEVLAALQKLNVGGVSPPVKLKDGFAVVKVEDVRYPEDPQARRQAEKAALSRRQKEALQKYYDALLKKYARIDAALLRKIDLEAKKPGLEALEKDQRVLAKIEGAQPITVGELTKEIEGSFYHGVESAAKEKRLNREKPAVFDALLSRRIVPLEARARKIPESAEFKERVEDLTSRLVFSKFIEKAIAPGVKVSEEDLKEYYERHKADFSYPAFYKLDALVFASVKDAQSAVDRLRSGTDWKWLNANAEGQVPESKRTVLLDGSTVSERTLPAEMVKALAGAKKGDYRLYAAASTEYAAIHVADVIASREQPFAEVRGEIGQKAFTSKLEEAIKTWAGKLRKASKVTVFITRIES